MEKNKNKIISGVDILINSKNKLGKHLDLVKTGTGAHKNQKKYNRKGKKNQLDKHSLKNYLSN